MTAAASVSRSPPTPPPAPALVHIPHLDQFTDQRQSRARDVHSPELEGLFQLCRDEDDDSSHFSNRAIYARPFEHGHHLTGGPKEP